MMKQAAVQNGLQPDIVYIRKKKNYRMRKYKAVSGAANREPNSGITAYKAAVCAAMPEYGEYWRRGARYTHTRESRPYSLQLMQHYTAFAAGGIIGLVMKLLKKKKRPACVPVGGIYVCFPLLSRLLPNRVVEKILGMMYHV